MMWKYRKFFLTTLLLMLLFGGRDRTCVHKDTLSFVFYSDVDECNVSSSLCDVNATCKNTIGSYLCTCNAGYHGDGKTCQKGKRRLK